nr:Krueppel-like factor 16 [Aegilops tauschii subsp. strangulata]
MATEKPATLESRAGRGHSTPYQPETSCTARHCCPSARDITQVRGDHAPRRAVGMARKRWALPAYEKPEGGKLGQSAYGEVGTQKAALPLPRKIGYTRICSSSCASPPLCSGTPVLRPSITRLRPDLPLPAPPSCLPTTALAGLAHSPRPRAASPSPPAMPESGPGSVRLAASGLPASTSLPRLVGSALGRAGSRAPACSTAAPACRLAAQAGCRLASVPSRAALSSPASRIAAFCASSSAPGRLRRLRLAPPLRAGFRIAAGCSAPPARSGRLTSELRSHCPARLQAAPALGPLRSSIPRASPAAPPLAWSAAALPSGRLRAAYHPPRLPAPTAWSRRFAPPPSRDRPQVGFPPPAPAPAPARCSRLAGSCPLPRPATAPAHSAACREKEDRGAGCPSGRREKG